MDEVGLQFAEQCLDKARPVVTIVIKQFRSETESKYVLNSPTESEQDHQVSKPPELVPREHDTQEQSREQRYSQDKYTNEQLPQEEPLEQRPQEKRPQEKRPQEKRPQEERPQEERPQEERPQQQPLLVRQSQIQMAAVLPPGNQSSRHSTLERLPLGTHYSRYNSLESFEFPEPAQFNARLKVSSSSNSEKEEELSAGEEVDNLADAREEPGNEDYQSDEEEEDISTKVGFKAYLQFPPPGPQPSF